MEVRRKKSRPASGRRRGCRCGPSDFRLLGICLLSMTTLVVFQVYLPGIDVPHRQEDSELPDQECPLVAGQESAVDINMKELYDSIAFEDMEGGVWRQGWDVQYNVTKWNTNKLRVFVVPHSHNDPGWLRTMREYYEEFSRRIITTVVTALKKDPRRRFIWEEMSYLQQWWEDASEELRRDCQEVVRNGQLEVVGGGWVMNDEANSHYFAIIDQIIEGNTWLHDTLGVVPTSAWAIDPFGHSPTMAYLHKRMGYQHMLIQRTHYEVKKALALEQSLEFWWRQSWDAGASTDVLCHMMPFYSYDVPHTCGPDPSICCQFDFARSPVGRVASCPWHKAPRVISEENVRERSELILDQWRKKSMLYGTNVVLVPLGDDFRYVDEKEAEDQFENFQRIFDYINEQSQELKAVAQFGTLNDYFTAVREESSRQSRANGGPSKPQFPVLSGDFFTYSDVRQDYWSGYYTSRPFYKAVDRVLEATLRGAEILVALAHAHTPNRIGTDGNGDGDQGFAERHAAALVSARRNLALFQHHDGVTGTAKDHVMHDYGARMHSALTDLQRITCEALAAFTSPSFLIGRGKNETPPSFFQPEEVRGEEDVLPSRLTMEVDDAGTVRRAVIYNSLEEPVDQVVSIVVASPALSVLTSTGECLQSQVNPEWTLFSHGQASGRQHRLFWRAVVPALGVQTYFIASAAHCPAPSLARLAVHHAPPSFECPRNYSCTFPSQPAVVAISNQRVTLSFAPDTGLLRTWQMEGSDTPASIEEEVATYTAKSSGAYLFHPIGEAEPSVKPGGLMLVSRGPLVEEVLSEFSHALTYSPLVRVARVYAGQSLQSFAVEMFHRVNMAVPEADNHELVVRYKTNLNTSTTNTSSVFYSDLNGFQMARREHYRKIPLQGNFYPMPALSFLQDPSGRRFSVHTRQAVGVASLETGWLEMMMDRRLVGDDARGLGQGVTDNHPTETTFHLLLETNSSSLPATKPSSTLFPSLLSHRVGARLNYPLSIYFGNPESGRELGLGMPEPISTSTSVVNGVGTTYCAVQSAIPCDYHIVNMKLQRPHQRAGEGHSEPRVSLLLQRRAWDSAFNPAQGHPTECPLSPAGKLHLGRVFGNYEVKEGKAVPLRLVGTAEEEDDSGALAGGRRRRAKEGRKEAIGIEESREMHAEMLGGRQTLVARNVVEMDPMEIRAFKFELAIRVPTANNNHAAQ